MHVNYRIEATRILGLRGLRACSTPWGYQEDFVQSL